jgi:general secretion pathway protein D
VAILQALEEVSGVNILSKPNILTSNHKQAKIVVGENIPFVLQSRITETDPATPTAIRTFEYRDVGIILEITPHVSQSGLIRLEILSEFTKFIDTGSIDTQRTTKREAQTNVTMNSGSTVVIGGMIRDDRVSLERKIPFVGDIPLLGELFKVRRDQLQKTNLLMFITPHVLTDQEDLDRMTAEKKNQMQEALQGSGPGKVPPDS